LFLKALALVVNSEIEGDEAAYYQQIKLHFQFDFGSPVAM
jgi:hypothetical protein